LQNTWGPTWGEKGFFRMKRGVDEFGIESICEIADPFIIENSTGNRVEKSNAPLNGNIFNSKNNKNKETNDIYTDGPISGINDDISIFDLINK
jgi:hypothetical protein